MRLFCEVCVQVYGTTVVLPRAKPAKATLTLGPAPMKRKREPTVDSVLLLVCTASDRKGVTFEIVKNVEQTFEKYVMTGMATVRLRQPAKEILISKADPVQLRSFLALLTSCAAGYRRELLTSPCEPEQSEGSSKLPKLSALTPARSKDFAPSQTTLRIADRRAYPRGSAGFPPTLTKLMINGCLQRFDQRVLKLTGLKVLDLTGNALGEDADRLNAVDLSSLVSLHELRLTSNGIRELSDVFFRCLPRRICLLFLDRNELETLPDAVCEMRIVELDVSGNRLTELPENIGAMAPHLRALRAGENRLMALPASAIELRLEKLHLYRNAFKSRAKIEMAESPSTDAPVGELFHQPQGLFDMTALVIMRAKLPLDCLPPVIQQRLKCSFAPCIACRAICYRFLENYLQTTVHATRIARDDIGLDRTTGLLNRIPINGFVCSTACRRREALAVRLG